ncbi:MAG: RidA family protein [Dehalococcoidia bacterium]
MSKRQTIIPKGWEIYEHLTFAPAVRRGNMLYISGTDATEIDLENGKLVIKGDIVQQYRTIYEKMKVILEAAGAGFDDIVWTCDYVKTKEGYKGTAAVRREYFGSSFPASTGIVVQDLLSKNALVEMDAIAILDE